MINIFDYFDYRKYLSNYFAEEKKNTSHFSHRYFCRKLGLKSKNFILFVMQGKRNLTNEMCFKISQQLKHDQSETAYFFNMVLFSQSKNYKEKDKYWEKIIKLRQKTKFMKIDEYQYEYFNNWYNVVIRELMVFIDKPIDYKILSRLVMPPITATQARRSVRLLLKLGMIKETESCFIQTDPIIKTDDKVNSLAIFNLHQTMSKLATHALENYQREERNFGSCIMALSKKGYKNVIDNVNELRDKLMSICELDDDQDRIYHMNFQLFPVSTTFKKGNNLEK